MKLVVVIFFTCLMQVSANSLAQRITMQKKNATITDVFEQIKLQTGYDVIWMHISAKVAPLFRGKVAARTVAKSGR